jgi:hypothetical protein
MKRIQICRNVRDEVHDVEARLEAALAGSKELVETLRKARAGLGLTGTVGDAAIARAEEAAAALEQAKAAMIESHVEMYEVYRNLRIPTTANDIIPTIGYAVPRQEDKVA